MNQFLRLIIIVPVLITNLFASGSELGHLPLYSVLPFVGILLSIAILPLVKYDFWHNNFGKISFFWLILFSIMFFSSFSAKHYIYYSLHTILGEFIPFIVLLTALYIISGGINISGNFTGSPVSNIIIIIIGTTLASFIGTTGSAILLVRPLVKSNLWRKHNVHVVIFFIFLVANIGGSLSPLGDPPLFLGFLEGVPFSWPFFHMFYPMLIASILLFIIFFILDSILYNRESNIQNNVSSPSKRFSLDGKINLVLILFLILVVYFSGHSSLQEPIFYNFLTTGKIFQILMLAALSFLSWNITPYAIRKNNDYTWFPILEIAKLFITIFITMIPVLEMLKSGQDGKLNFVTNLVSSDFSYFWVTGFLSSILDNAPTYLVFFKMAQGTAGINEFLLSSGTTLLAISLGAVFMGAMTYIGNAPNFMIRSIAESYKVKMPSFFGYIMWSSVFLLPVFFIITYLIL